MLKPGHSPGYLPFLRPVIPVSRFLTKIIPRVSWELERWDRQLELCPDKPLFIQAAESKRRKRFHSQGGSFFALYNPYFSSQLVAVIVALQTISDYLDNLCDRGGVLQENAFRSLHRSFSDALSVNPICSGSYYRHYPYQRDGGYLQSLVSECRRQIATFPSYRSVQSEALKLASLYCDLQIYKHLDPTKRRLTLKCWVRKTAGTSYPDIYWWEYAAACGSTLGLFALLAASTFPDLKPEDSALIVKAYFPWICGLHILLDYLIDQQEDLRGQDFNFVACYFSDRVSTRRLHMFLNSALKQATALPQPRFHQTIVKGLLAVYLSDPKVKQQGLQPVAKGLIDRAGAETKAFYHLCLALRKAGIL